METEIIQLDGWTLRGRIPTAGTGYPVLLMLHGWLGDEDVMWIFAAKVPESFAIFAPRALHPAPDGGYSWVKNRSSGFSTFADFEPSCSALDGLIEALAGRHEGDFSSVHVMGFSQGAALAYSWTARSRRRVRSLAALAGFVPDGTEARLANGAWSGLPVFIAHGIRDKIVPLERMQSGVELVRRTGADLTVCEDDVGHKLSVDCLRGLGRFYENIAPGV